MKLDPVEPQVQSWHMATLEDIWQYLGDAPAGRPLIIAVDGRSASGKTTLASVLAGAAGAVVVHTDDIAWFEPLFAWDHLLRQYVLEPARRGAEVRFTPPAWAERGRTGSIEVPEGTRILIVEGVGSSCADVADLLDAAIWVQADAEEAEKRGIARDAASGENGNYEETVAFWHEWNAAERAYLAEDRPWERANLIVAGTPPMPLPAGYFAVAEGPARAAARLRAR